MAIHMDRYELRWDIETFFNWWKKYLTQIIPFSIWNRKIQLLVDCSVWF